MDILFLLIPISFVFIGLAIALFFWASKNGQFDDLEGPAHSILFDDDKAMQSSTSIGDTSKEEQEQGSEALSHSDHQKTERGDLP